MTSFPGYEGSLDLDMLYDGYERIAVHDPNHYIAADAWFKGQVRSHFAEFDAEGFPDYKDRIMKAVAEMRALYRYGETHGMMLRAAIDGLEEFIYQQLTGLEQVVDH